MKERTAGGRVLVAEEDLEVRWGLKESLAGAGYRVAEAEDGPAAGAILDTGEIAAAVIDPHIPDFDALRLVKRTAIPAIPCILTGELRPGVVASELVFCRSVACLPKPYSHKAVLTVLARLFDEQRRAGEERRGLRDFPYHRSRGRILFDDDPDLIYFLDLDGNFIDANHAGCSAAGKSLEALKGTNLKQARIKDLVKIGRKPFRAAAAGEPVNILLSYKESRRGRQLKDIEIRRVELNGSPVVLCRVRDVSDRTGIRSG